MIRDVIVIGAPRGGAGALLQLIDGLPADLPAAIFVVLHAHPDQPNLLADVANAPGRMRAAEAIDGEPVELRRIYVAADSKHLGVEGGTIHLTDSWPGAECRPSIDVLFRTAARSYTDRVVAIALLHIEKEGGLGLDEVRRNGGRTITQRNPQMLEPPRSINGDVVSHHHLDLPEIAPLVVRYVRCQQVV